MRKSGLLLTTVFLLENTITIMAQPEGKLSFQPYLSIEKNIYCSRPAIEFPSPESRYTTDSLRQVDLISIGGSLRKSIFVSSVSLAAPYGNGADMDFTPYLDLNAGLDFADFGVYGGAALSFGDPGYEKPYDMINPVYIGVLTKHNLPMLNLVNDFQFRFGDLNHNFDYCGYTVGSRAFFQNKYIRPYLYLSMEKWLINDDDDNGMFDNAAFNLGLGILLGGGSGNKCIFMRSVKSRPTVRKPNIYLYPPGPCTVNVKVKPNGKITASIPEYRDGWSVKANPDGSIPGTEGFLFYEADVAIDTPKPGWCVAKGDINSFFIQILPRYGFNKREIADFIDYWSVILTESPYYNIYPVLNDAVDEVCPLTVSPEPDNILRLWFIFKPVDDFKKLSKPKIPMFKRDGFVVTEWGGIIN